MTLIIEIPCKTGIEMENNLNKAIDDFAEVLAKRGFSEIKLTACDENLKLIYNIQLK